jgi:hypothetical protein
VNQRGSSPQAEEPDLIDRIAYALPLEVRAEYYRELRHCRSLPENDEMLRILRAIQFLTLLIHQAPERLATERDHLDRRLTSCTAALQAIDERLAALPTEVASQIGPQAIASNINESLRQQFLASTVPQTAEALAAIAAQLKRTVAEFQRSAGEISSKYQGSATEADRAIRNIESAVSAASGSARSAIAALQATFLHEYRWSVAALVSVALVIGFLGGLRFAQEQLSVAIPRSETAAPITDVITKK